METVVRNPGTVPISKLALVPPAGMNTLFGTVTVVRLALIFTHTPTGGAGPPRVTVPVAVLPPTTEAGVTTTEARGGKLGYSMSGCDNVTPPPETDIVTCVGA